MRVFDPLISWRDEEPLRVVVNPGEVRLAGSAADDSTSVNDVLPSVGSAPYERPTPCSRTRHLDDAAVAGRELRYIVVPYDAAGRRGRPSNTVIAELASVAT